MFSHLTARFKKLKVYKYEVVFVDLILESKKKCSKKGNDRDDCAKDQAIQKND